MCKKINRFFPCLICFFIVASIGLSYFTASTGIKLAYWQQCILSEVILLIPALIYVAINKINIIACIPYRKLRWQDALMSLLTGYLLVPVVLFINVVTSVFATNYLQESSLEFTSYPYLIQVVLIAVLPAFVEEFIFRGLIYHSYRKNGLVGACVFSALAFGVMHMNLNQFFYAFVIGIFFAKMVEVTGSMWSSVIAHFAFNTYSITMVQILKLLGNDVNDMAQSAESASELISTVADSHMMSIVMKLTTSVIHIIIFGMMAVAFILLANMLINHMAKMNGRYEYMQYYTKMGLREMNGEKFVTLPYAVTVILAFIYMVVIEILQHL